MAAALGRATGLAPRLAAPTCPAPFAQTRTRRVPQLAQQQEHQDIASTSSVQRLPGIGRQQLARRSRCAAAAADASDAAPESKTNGLLNLVYLAGIFGAWYGTNIIFNIYNKQVLKVFPCPLSCTALQFAIGGLVACVCWATGLVPRPKVTVDTLKGIWPLAVVHTLGNLLTNVSLGAVAVSFTHTIKAMEPFFSVLLSALFLGDRPAPAVVLSLVPIVGGVALASMSEATFNWRGFSAAVGSCVALQSRNVVSKKLMIKKDGLDNVSLFSIITILSFFLLAPVAVAVEGFNFTPAAMATMGITDAEAVWRRLIVCGLCFHSYQQISYLILSKVTPVTHSIGNCMKRVVVIVSSVVFFAHPMSNQNMLGTAIALFGVFAYSQVKRLSKGGKAVASAD